MEATTTKNEIFIKVLKYDEWFTLRTKDYKTQHWFSFPNQMLFHPDFDEITGEELKWFVWVVSVCSKMRSGAIRFNFQHAINKLQMKKVDLDSMLVKLKSKQILIIDEATFRKENELASARPESGQMPTATEQNKTEQNKTSISQVFDFESFNTNQTLWPLIKGMNRELVQVWLNEYEFEWMTESLVKAVKWFINKKTAKLSDPCDVWALRFDGWLNKAKNPRKRQNQAIEEAFLNDLNLETAIPEVS